MFGTTLRSALDHGYSTLVSSYYLERDTRRSYLQVLRERSGAVCPAAKSKHGLIRPGLKVHNSDTQRDTKAGEKHRLVGFLKRADSPSLSAT
jgi:hypothetical protein